MDYPNLLKLPQTFTVGFVKLLSTNPIHIDVWGNFPFNSERSVMNLLHILQAWDFEMLNGQGRRRKKSESLKASARFTLNDDELVCVFSFFSPCSKVSRTRIDDAGM